jgi:hypothetical protein
MSTYQPTNRRWVTGFKPAATRVAVGRPALSPEAVSRASPGRRRPVPSDAGNHGWARFRNARPVSGNVPIPITPKDFMSTFMNRKHPMSMLNHPPPRRRLILAALCLTAMPMSLHALSMGPGMFMVQDVPPGREVDVRKLGGMVFTVFNKTDKDQDYNLACKRPAQGGLAVWEKGYEEIPDPAWCRLEETVFTIPPRSEKTVGVIINIPDAPENYNRKFMLAVVLQGGKAVGTSIGLAVACRIQIETVVNDRLGSGTGAPLATVPGTISFSGKPGAKISGPVLLRNNTSEKLEATIERVSQVYDDPERQVRYVSNGFLTKPEPWLAPQTVTFALDAGAANLMYFTGTIPTTAVAGKSYEELAFFHAKSAFGKDIMTFVRLHCLVEGAEPPKEEPPKTEPPKIEPPTAEPPKTEAPKAEPPKAETPKAEAPKAEPVKPATPAPETPTKP